jgi:hypothetical protein
MKKLAALIVVVVLAVPALAYAVPKITGADVVDDSLTGADILESTLGQVPIAERAIRADSADFARNAEHAGTADTADDATRAGTLRWVAVYYSDLFQIPAGEARTRGLACPVGWEPIGGGFDYGGSPDGIQVTRSRKNAYLWEIVAYNPTAVTQSAQIQAICAKAGDWYTQGTTVPFDTRPAAPPSS